MDNSEFLYQVHYIQYMQARRYITKMRGEIRYGRTMAIMFATFFLVYVAFLFVQFDAWNILFAVIFAGASGVNVWAGWIFYPRQKRFWEHALADHQKELETLAPNVKETPEIV